MACQTRHGPSTAIKCYEEVTGIRLTQSDWHSLRQTVEDKMGEKLSREVIPADEASTVAADYYTAIMQASGREVDPADRDAFVADFTSERVTAGTLHIMDEMARNGVPADIINRPRRGSRSTPVAPQPVTSDAELDANGVMRLIAEQPAGAMGGTSDKAVLDAGALTETLMGDTRDANFTPEQGVESAVIARDAADKMRSTVDAIGADLAERMYDNGIHVIHDDLTGTEMTPHSGYRYRGWDHEGVQGALADELATKYDLSSEQTASLLKEYGEFASVDGYRAGALREYGLRASAYAERVPGDRTLTVRYADKDDRIVPSAAVNGVLESRAAIAAMPEVAEQARKRIADMPLEDAVREYAAVRRVERTMAKVAAGVEYDAATRIIDDGLVDGVAGYNARTTAGGERWDATELERKIVPLAAEKARVEPRVAHEVIADFKEVARVSRYKVRALKSVDIDVDDYRHKTPGTRKLAPVE